MIDNHHALSDRHLDTATAISCKREPASFAFLCARAALAPIAIDRLNFDIASADFHQGRPSVWATLDMRGEESDAATLPLLGFDDGFLRPFIRAVLEASSSRVAHRMTIIPEPARPLAPRVVDYVRSQGGARIRELIVTPYEQVLSIAAVGDPNGAEETLFQLPRTDSFLRHFARVSQVTDNALRDVLSEMERFARNRTTGS